MSRSPRAILCAASGLAILALAACQPSSLGPDPAPDAAATVGSAKPGAVCAADDDCAGGDAARCLSGAAFPDGYCAIADCAGGDCPDGAHCAGVLADDGPACVASCLDAEDCRREQACVSGDEDDPWYGACRPRAAGTVARAAPPTSTERKTAVASSAAVVPPATAARRAVASRPVLSAPPTVRSVTPERVGPPALPPPVIVGPPALPPTGMAGSSAPPPRPTASVPRIRGFPYDDIGLDPRLGHRLRPLAYEGDKSDAPGHLDRQDHGWVGLVERGRVLIERLFDERLAVKPRWVSRAKRRWVARSALTRDALPANRRNWLGAKIVGLDAQGRRCAGTVVRLESEARARRTRDREPGEPTDPRTPREVYTRGYAYLFGVVRWERAHCGRTVLVARRRGASLPLVIGRAKLARETAAHLKSRFRWSPAWALVQRRFEKRVRETNPSAYRAVPRSWDAGKVDVAAYRGAGRTVYLAQASYSRPCEAPDGHLGLRLYPGGDPESDEVVVQDRWFGVGALPQVLLYFPGHRRWLGVTPGRALLSLGDGAIDVDYGDVLRGGCNC